MSYDPTLQLDLSETTITFGNDNLHWGYVQVTIAEGGNTAVIIASEAHIDPLQYWESDGLIHYKIGWFDPVVGGKREAHLLWNGIKGGAGASVYLYIAWASDAAGTGFTMVFDPALKYIAVKPTTAPIAAPVVGDFAGLWVKYVGENGNPGAPGTSAFVYIAYASDAAGTGFTMTFDAALDYIAVKATTVAIPAPVVGDFAGLWKNYKGAAGASGETDIFQVHINFEVAEAETYVCPYALKFTAMIHQQANAPTLSVALNTDMAQYGNLIITPDAVGIVTLTGQWL